MTSQANILVVGALALASCLEPPGTASTDAAANSSGGRGDAAVAIDAADAGPFIIRGAAQGYHVVTTVTVQNANAALDRLSVVLPAPQTSPYQDVANLDIGAGSLRSIPETDDKYVLFTQTTDLPAPGSSAEFAVSYDVTLYALQADLARVGTILPYDVNTDIYRWYTGASGVYVVPDNPTIQSISATLWEASQDVLNYAVDAYNYVATNYQYLNPGTGVHPLEHILLLGGGDCGNLSSIYVSLLRARGIPARHLVTVRPDSSYHVWSDFYLQGYGWVPVDVTGKLQTNGDYFGVVRLGGNGIIMNKEVALTIDNGVNTVQLTLLQLNGFWFWSSTAGAVVTASYQIRSERL